MDDESVPAPANSRMFFPNALILYGVKLNSETHHCSIVAGSADFQLRSQLFHREAGAYVAMENTDYSVVLTYGYSFEGHCYRMDAHRIFVVIGSRDEDAVGCGFENPDTAPVNTQYRMWRIRSSTELMEIATDYGDAKTLILDANLPGRRSPNSYAIHLNMAHRNGRLARE